MRLRLGSLMQEILIGCCKKERDKHELLLELNPKKSDSVKSAFYRASRELEEKELIKKRSCKTKHFISLTKRGEKILNPYILQNDDDKLRVKEHVSKIWTQKSNDFHELRSCRYEIIPKEHELKRLSNYTPINKIITSLNFINESRPNDRIDADDIALEILYLTGFLNKDKQKKKEFFLFNSYYSLSSSLLRLSPEEILEAKNFREGKKTENDFYYHRAALWRTLQLGRNLGGKKNREIEKLHQELLKGNLQAIKQNFEVKFALNGNLWLKKLFFCHRNPQYFSYCDEIKRLDKKFINILSQNFPIELSRGIKNIDNDDLAGFWAKL